MGQVFHKVKGVLKIYLTLSGISATSLASTSLNVKYFTPAEVQFGKKARADTVPAAPSHKMVCVDTDFPFMPVNNR